MECGKAAAEIPAAAETAAGSAPDFMIHGVMKYTIGGQELWVTTTTVGLLVITVMLILLAFTVQHCVFPLLPFRISWRPAWRCWKA